MFQFIFPCPETSGDEVGALEVFRCFIFNISAIKVLDYIFKCIHSHHKSDKGDLMEYMVVRLYGHDSSTGIHVLVNGEQNGFIGDTLMLDRGVVYVSADIEGADTRRIYLFDTTPANPMEVLIHVQP